MNFASLDFWIRLGSCVVISLLLLRAVRAVAPGRVATIGKLCFLASALYLLQSESWLTLWAFCWVVGLGWVAVLAHRIGRPGIGRALVFWSCILLQLLPLLFFKYWNFIAKELLNLDAVVPHALIPMGLSFYTFQTLGFCFDSRKYPDGVPKFLDYLNFSSFFPQIVAGPIERRDDLLPQIQNVRFALQRHRLDQALSWIVLGLFYKLVLADNLGVALDGCHRIGGNAYHVWIRCLCDGLRIYFDFGGYSFIALGLGYLFGVDLTLNFRSPYTTTDLRQFWRNWHITLSGWLRDYIYIPLGGRKVSRWWLNTLLVFLVSGLWHGAGWNFILWGLLHGVGVVFCSLGKPWPLPLWVKWLATTAYVFFCWLFFFETDVRQLFDQAATLLTPGAYGLSQIKATPAYFGSPSDIVNLGALLAFAVLVHVLEFFGKRRGDAYGLMRSLPVSLAMVFVIVMWAPLEESAFIYFNF